MFYCKRCVYPSNHPLNIIFDEKGICSGCRVHEEKYEIDWEKKYNDLIELTSPFYKKSNAFYDCVIPVSGSGDDFFVVDFVKNKLNFNPLLVTYNTHFSTKVGIRNLARLITELDCDHLMSTVGPDTVKEVTRLTFKEFGNIYWHVLAGSQTFPVQVATKFKIPLIIWGVNGWLDQVGMFSHHNQVEMTKKVRKEHSLKTFDADYLIGKSKKLSIKDLQAYTYPSDEQLEKSRVRGIYLGNYIFWDSKIQIEQMIDKYGYETSSQDRTYNTYESIYCHNNAGIHDYIKYLIYGYSKIYDHVSRDIRLKRLSRENGIKLIKKYQDVKPKNLNKFFEWLDISEHDFYSTVNHFRDKRAWRFIKKKWELINPICDEKDDILNKNSTKEIIEKNYYKTTPLLEIEDKNNDYILMGRTYLDKFNFKAEEG